jgi:hypothetical protein
MDSSDRAQLRHYRILHSIQLLLVSDVAIPVSSFFRFGDDAHGIYGPSVDPMTFSGSFSILTAFRQEEGSIGPLFSFHDINESVLTGILESSVLKIKYANRKVTYGIHLNHQFVRGTWYTLILAFLPSSLQYVVNGTELVSVEFPRVEVQQRVQLQIG